MIALNKEHLNKKGAFFLGTIVEATDERIVVNYGTSKKGKIVSYICSFVLALIGVFFVVFLTILAIDGEFSNSVWALVILYILVLAFPLMGLFVYKNTKASSNHILIFNRLDKTITHPQSLMSEESVTQIFNFDNIFIADYDGVIQSGVKIKGVPVFNRFPIFHASDEKEIENYWDYIQYYMFNPTLPLGTAFDNYR